MKNLNIQVKIDETVYTEDQIKRYQYERTLHALHELKTLGADITDGEKNLSHIDINWLLPENAEKILLNTKCALGESGMQDLFGDILADSESRWKSYLENYDPAESHTGGIEMNVQGVGLQEAFAVLGGAKDVKKALSVHPEHYIVAGDIATGQRGMEVVGGFGEPIMVSVSGSDQIPKGLPIVKDPQYPIIVFGEFILRDGTNTRSGACHMLRNENNGFKMKSILFCPGKAPKAIAEGHKLHFAIELLNCVKTAYANNMK